MRLMLLLFAFTLPVMASEQKATDKPSIEHFLKVTIKGIGYKKTGKKVPAQTIRDGKEVSIMKDERALTYGKDMSIKSVPVKLLLKKDSPQDSDGICEIDYSFGNIEIKSDILVITGMYAMMPMDTRISIESLAKAEENGHPTSTFKRHYFDNSKISHKFTYQVTSLDGQPITIELELAKAYLRDGVYQWIKHTPAPQPPGPWRIPKD